MLRKTMNSLFSNMTISSNANANYSNILDSFKSRIADNLGPLLSVETRKVFEACELTSKLEFGDFQLSLPRLGIRKSSPEEYEAATKEIVEKFPHTIGIIRCKNNFLQVELNSEVLKSEVLSQIFERKGDYGRNDSGAGKKLLIEFSSPNIAKPFHMGHIRSTIIGSFLTNLYRYCGWEVISANYLGDWGKQFGLLAVGFEKFGDEEELAKDPIKHLYTVYVKINLLAKGEDVSAANHTNVTEDQLEVPESAAKGLIHDQARAFFKRMEDGDEQALAVWQRFRDLSIEKLKASYERLNVEFDLYRGESLVAKDQINELYELLTAKNLITESNGAKLIDLDQKKPKLGKAIVQKSDGATLYLTRDLAEAIYRHRTYHFDKMIYVVASQQDQYFRQVFKILELLGFEWSKNLEHVSHGLVQGMSTRQGKAIFLEDVLDTAKERMFEVMQKNDEKFNLVDEPLKTADIIGKTGIMALDQKGKRINDYAFSWKDALNYEGDTGAYLQYAHARLSSIIRKASEIYGFTANPQEADFSKLVLPQEIHITRLLLLFPETVKLTFKSQEPVSILNYLFRVTHSLNSSYDACRVVGIEDKDLAFARLALYTAAKQVLANGFMLLGYTPLERM